MAAAGSRFISDRRGATTGRGAKARREGLAPSPSLDAIRPYVPAIDSLEDISGWLGTFRERLRQARNEEQAAVAAVVEQLKARYGLRRGRPSLNPSQTDKQGPGAPNPPAPTPPPHPPTNPARTPTRHPAA